MSRRHAGPFSTAFTAVFVTLATLWALFPFYWAIITSVKTRLDWFTLSFIPFLQFQPTLADWNLQLGPAGRG